MENKLLLFMEDFGYAPDSYIETVISDYEHKGIVFYVKHFNDLMTWLSESPNAVEFVNNLMRTQYFSSLQNLRSSAGKAHPFKGGMKGGLTFFLKA